MVYTYYYDTDYQPAMPVVEIRVGRPLTRPTLELIALVDSGADATIVPVRYLQQIRARQGRISWMRGMTGERTLVDLYPVALYVGPLQLGRIQVVANTRTNETIIGRDVLNQLEVTLNGPAFAVMVLS